MEKNDETPEKHFAEVDMLTAALSWAENGTPVFPCKPSEPKAKSPLTLNGWKDATTDASTICRWWEKNPKALIGVPTGATSGFWVLDVDDPALFEECAINLPETKRHRTGKGYHLLWRCGDVEVRNAQRNVSGWPFPELPGAEVRGEGGYVIVPPSMHPSGNRYEVTLDTDIADTPKELLRIVTKAKRPEDGPQAQLPSTSSRGTSYGLAALRAECITIREAGNGAQEHTLNVAALKMGGLVEGGELMLETAQCELIAAGCEMTSFREKDPWTIESVRKKVERGLADGQRQPRSAPVSAAPEVPATPTAIATSGDTFPTLSLREIVNMPPAQWRIEGLIPEHGLSMLYGRPGSHKTFLAVDMALRCAYGMDWHGRQAKRCGVLYIAAEGQFGVAQRINAWRRKHGRDHVDAPFRLLPVAVHLLDPSNVARLLQTIDKMREEIDFDIGMVFIDTVSRSIPGQDENSQEAMSAFIDACAKVQNHCGGAVIGVHHSGKDMDRGMRGSSVLLGGCDAVIQIKKGDDVTTLVVEKQKDGEALEDMHFSLDQVEFMTGLKLVTSLVPTLSHGPKLIDEKTLGWPQINEIFRRIDEAYHAGKPWSVFPQSRSTGRYAPAIISMLYGVSEATALRFLKEWQMQDYLETVNPIYKGRCKGLRVVRFLSPT